MLRRHGAARPVAPKAPVVQPKKAPVEEIPKAAPKVKATGKKAPKKAE